jgi:hypothetical protein
MRLIARALFLLLWLTSGRPTEEESRLLPTEKGFRE